MTGSPVAATADVVAAASVDAYARIVAALIRVTGDWTLAEDCVQEALTLALQRWPQEGVPGNPGGWLMTVARNRAIDVLRRAWVERRKLAELTALAVADPGPAPAEEVVDDRLRLVFTCCHPALALEARVALTLRTICGVPTADIARAFLVSEPTMTRRLTRAKTKIADAGTYRVPTGPALTERPPVFWRCCTCCSPTATTPTASPPSPQRRSAWPASSKSSCPIRARCPRCWRCSCSSTPGAPFTVPVRSPSALAVPVSPENSV